MKKFTLITLFAVLTSVCSMVNAATKKETIDELFEVMEAEKLIDSIYQQMGGMIDNMQSQMGVTAEEMPIFSKYNQKMTEVMRSEMNWSKMSPGLTSVYETHFTQEELEGLVEFYKSPIGQRFVEKMPIISQQSMQIGQQIAMDAMPQIQAIAVELQAELQAFRDSKK